MQNSVNHKAFFYPPGGILLWILIYIELFTYGLALFALVFYGAQERELFHAESSLLSKPIGMLNTLLLLTSGYLVAKSVQFFKMKFHDKSVKFMNMAMVLGFGFLILKLIEYGLKRIPD